MYAYLTYLTFATLTSIIFGCEHYHDPACQDVRPIDGDHFMNQFIVKIEGGEEAAKKVALDIGFNYKKPMKTHKDHYFFTHLEVYERHKNRHEDILKILREHDDVKVADQQYVWRPTINELESYEDMVGLEEPLEVKTSHFHPDEIEIEGRSAWELIRPDDVFIEPEPIQNYPPIHTLVDFDKLYAEKNREKEKRAQERRLQEELEKKQEEERRSATTSVTLDSGTVPIPQNEETDQVEKPQSVVDDEKILGNHKIDEDKNSEKDQQDEQIENKEKPEIDDDKIVENKNIDRNEKLESADDKILKTEKTDKESKLESGDEKVWENPNNDEETGKPGFDGKIIEKPGIDGTSTVDADDEATVETYEE